MACDGAKELNAKERAIYESLTRSDRVSEFGISLTDGSKARAEYLLLKPKGPCILRSIEDLFLNAENSVPTPESKKKGVKSLTKIVYARLQILKAAEEAELSERDMGLYSIASERSNIFGDRFRERRVTEKERSGALDETFVNYVDAAQSLGAVLIFPFTYGDQKGFSGVINELARIETTPKPERVGWPARMGEVDLERMAFEASAGALDPESLPDFLSRMAKGELARQDPNLFEKLAKVLSGGCPPTPVQIILPPLPPIGGTTQYEVSKKGKEDMHFCRDYVYDELFDMDGIDDKVLDRVGKAIARKDFAEVEAAIRDFCEEDEVRYEEFVKLGYFTKIDD